MTNRRFQHLDLSVPCLFFQLRKETSRKEVFSYDWFLRKALILVQKEWHAAVTFTEAFSALCKAADGCLLQHKTYFQHHGFSSLRRKTPHNL